MGSYSTQINNQSQIFKITWSFGHVKVRCSLWHGLWQAFQYGIKLFMMKVLLVQWPAHWIFISSCPLIYMPVAPPAHKEWDPMPSSKKLDVSTPVNRTAFFTVLTMSLLQMNCQAPEGTSQKVQRSVSGLALLHTKSITCVTRAFTGQHGLALFSKTLWEMVSPCQPFFWLLMVSDTGLIWISNWYTNCSAISYLSVNNFTSCNGKICVCCCLMANINSLTCSKK